MAQGLLRTVKSNLSNRNIRLVLAIIRLCTDIFLCQILRLHFLGLFELLGIRVYFDLARLQLVIQHPFLELLILAYQVIALLDAILIKVGRTLGDWISSQRALAVQVPNLSYLDILRLLVMVERQVDLPDHILGLLFGRGTILKLNIDLPLPQLDDVQRARSRRRVALANHALISIFRINE